MKFEDVLNQAKDKAISLLNSAEDKSTAILEAMDILVTANNSQLISQIREEADRAKADEQFAQQLNLRTLSKDEKEFYQSFTNLKQAITAEQVDIIPTTIIDRTLDNVRKESKLLKLISFAPADVKKWLVAEKTGSAAWGAWTDALTAELSASISALNIEVSKLHVLLLIPKAIRELGLQFVDKYFMAILQEAFENGVEVGFLVEDGDNAPIGIYNSITNSTNGVHAAKTPSVLITDFSPKTLAPVKKALSNNGQRSFDKIYLVCNPADEADYVDPALFDREGRVVSSYKNLEVIATPNNPQGKAAFVLGGMYVMGLTGFKVTEYKEVKALDDLDAIVVKAYGNGRAVDDNVAFVFDVTKLEEYVPAYLALTEDGA